MIMSGTEGGKYVIIHIQNLGCRKEWYMQIRKISDQCTDTRRIKNACKYE